MFGSVTLTTGTTSFATNGTFSPNLKAAGISAGITALFAGIEGGIKAANDERNFWTGKIVPKTTTEYSQVNIPDYRRGYGMSYNGPGEPITYGPYTLKEFEIIAQRGGGMSFWNRLKLVWDLKIIGAYFPDLISFDVNLGSTFGAGGSMTYSMNMVTWGNPSISFTATAQNRFGGEIDWGVNVNIGYYQGNPLMLSKAALEGPVKSISAGYIYNVQAYYGYNLEGILKWKGFGTGIGLSGGGSYGSGSTYLIWH